MCAVHNVSCAPFGLEFVSEIRWTSRQHYSMRSELHTLYVKHNVRMGGQLKQTIWKSNEKLIFFN